MYSTLLVKIKANNAVDALKKAKNQVLPFIRRNKIAVEWDFVNDKILPIKASMFGRGWFKNIRTFADLDRRFIGEAESNIVLHRGFLRDELLKIFVRRFVTAKNASKYLNHKNPYGKLDKDVRRIVKEEVN